LNKEYLCPPNVKSCDECPRLKQCLEECDSEEPQQEGFGVEEVGDDV